ncbi:cytochrome P450 [Nocardia sp. NPDC004068]|uniref:cytochrome P450 n=1 Tax=Nocardia sp. NPDC004068 TaxID=3364303 RepID=UPI0036B14A2E
MDDSDVPATPSAGAGRCPAGHASPVDVGDELVPLYAPDFAQDPHGVYREMRRRFGSLAPVELAPGVGATLVLGYHTALRILNDPDHFPADPRTWQKSVPADSPVLPMMRWYPAARYNSGLAHLRYREPSRAAIDAIDLHALHQILEDHAVTVINGFCESGEVDVLGEYARPLVLRILNHVVGCPPEIGERVAAGMAARFDAGAAAEDGMQLLHTALMDLIRHKRRAPGPDMTSILISHEHGLSDDEVCAQLMSIYGAGVEAVPNLITNTVLLMLTDDRFGGNLLDGSLSTRDALDEVLFKDPPMANFCTTYPRQPTLLDGTWLPAHKPVVISIAACNNDPAITAGERTGNRSHLAWSAGPHRCPARHPAYQIAQDAIDQLLDALPDLTLARPQAELHWRPGPFHRALSALPVTFKPAPLLPTGLYSFNPTVDHAALVTAALRDLPRPAYRNRNR